MSTHTNPGCKSRNNRLNGKRVSTRNRCGAIIGDLALGIQATTD